MEVGKTYRVVVAFKYDVYETTVLCSEVLPKSYRVRHSDTRQYPEVALIRKVDIVECEEIQTR